MTEFEERDNDVNEPLINNTDETSFINQASGSALNPSHNTADDILTQRGFPSFDELFSKITDRAERKLAKEFVIKEANNYGSAKELLDAYDSKLRLPSPPRETPGVELAIRNKIDLGLSRLDITKSIDHTKFIVSEKGDLYVKTSKGTSSLTQKQNNQLFLVRPQIPNAEYESLLGISKSEYKRRVGLNNARVVSPVDAEVDEDQNSLENFATTLLETPTKIKERVGGFIDRLRSNRIRSEFNYQKLDDEISLTEFDAENPDRLPERDLEAIDKRFQTIEGQIQIATSKVGEISLEISELEKQETRTSDEDTKLGRLNDELQAQLQIINDLKNDYTENIAKMRRQRNIALGIGVGVVGLGSILGGILSSVFDTVTKVIGSDAVKDLIPKSTDPKDIANSGIGKIITKKLSDLADLFADKMKNSVGAWKSFWHMMEAAVKYMQAHLWLIVGMVLAMIAIEWNKKRK